MTSHRIGVDLDDTLFDFVRKLLTLYNQKYGDNISIEQITDYRIHRFLKPECLSLFQEFATDDFFAELTPLDHSLETLEMLNTRHDLYFVTAGHPATCRARDLWLSKVFDWYSTSQLIRCQNKALLDFDILIDDHVDNLIDFHGWKILFDRPWNSGPLPVPMYRVYNWMEINKLLIWS